MLQGTRCHWKSTPQMPREDCLRCAATGTNPCGYNLPLIALMLRDRDPAVVGCSATMLEGCPREHGLKKQQDWYIDPDRGYTRAYGSLGHAGSEYLATQLGLPSVTTEVRYARPVTLADGRTVLVTAQLDLLHQQADGTVVIRDLKLTSSLAPSKLDRKVRNYRVQFSVQRWILIYHQLRVASIDLDFMAHDGKRSVNLYPEGDPELVGASLMTLEEVDAYLAERLPPLVDALDGRLPDVLTDPRDFWRCRYCDCSDICQDLYGRPLPAFAAMVK